MKQMLYLKMLAWLEDNIYCNPSIDDLAQYMGYSRGLSMRCFISMVSSPSGSISAAAVDHRGGESAINTATDRRHCLAVKL